jgi:transposase
MEQDRSLLVPRKAVRGEEMREPDEVAAMIRLYRLGWGVKRIARELGCSHMTVRRYLSAGGWEPYKRPGRHKTLGGYSAWLAERFQRHRGNADVVRQELLAEHGVEVSLRTVERAVTLHRLAP